MPTLLILGHGYSADFIARRVLDRGWRVIGTTRSPGRAEELRASGVEPLIWPCDLTPALSEASHLLASAAPGEHGDPFLGEAGAAIASARPEWVGYLSTTGVYGDHKGGWVDEETAPRPQSTRAVQRILAETQWMETGLPVHIFRLAGIYGPGRGPFRRLRAGTAQRIVKQDQFFSRIHVDDLAATLLASIDRPSPGRIYNVCDDEPAPPEDVLAHAAELLHLPVPPAVAFEAADLPEMTRSFYSESKRVRNSRIKMELGVRLSHPGYREGLAAILSAES